MTHTTPRGLRGPHVATRGPPGPRTGATLRLSARLLLLIGPGRSFRSSLDVDGLHVITAPHVLLTNYYRLKLDRTAGPIPSVHSALAVRPAQAQAPGSIN